MRSSRTARRLTKALVVAGGAVLLSLLGGCCYPVGVGFGYHGHYGHGHGHGHGHRGGGHCR